MRRAALLCLLPLLGCGAVDPASVRASDLGWLTGTWRGAADDGTVREQYFSAPADGAMQGSFRVFRDGEQIAESSMRIVSGTNGVVMIGALEGEAPRALAMVDVSAHSIRFRARAPEFPAEVTYRRSGSWLTITLRGASGLGSVREVTNDLRLVD